MKAAVLEVYHQPLQIRETAVSEPRPQEVTVEVKACGLCSTDVHISEGKIPTVKLPLIPGHEFAGVLTRIGEGVKDFAVGDRVVVCVDASCGRCDFCLRGETNRCINLIRIGFERSGGMGEFVNVPAANLEKIAPQIPFEKAAIVPDAVVCMYRGLKSLGGVTAGTKVAIVGVGGLGMQGIRIGRLLGAHVTVTSRNDQKLDLAKAIGADLTVNTKRENLLEVAKKMGGFDVVADLIGTRESILEAVTLCRNGGKVIALAYVDPRMEIPSYEIVIREKQVIGSRAVTRSEFREVVNLVNSGKLDPHIGEVIPIRHVNEALENLKNGKFLTRSVLRHPF
jgi:alcohol dehydrogenase, propanol-preferring